MVFTGRSIVSWSSYIQECSFWQNKDLFSGVSSNSCRGHW